MKQKTWITNLITFAVIALTIAFGFLYFKPKLSENKAHTHELGESDHEESFERGPHRGRLLVKDSFQTEVTIYEPEGIPPRFRIYFYDEGELIDPSKVDFAMELTRINRTEKIPFRKDQTYLESTVEASEPHSFEVEIAASYQGKNYKWKYYTFEGRVELTPESIAANKIKIEKADSAYLESILDVLGKINPNEETTVYITPRFPGMVKAVYKKLGDRVHKDEVLAIIESNESLQNYEIKSEISGTVIKKNINVGTYLSGQDSAFVISDLSSVWADFNIYQQDLHKVQLGDPIAVSNLDGTLHQNTEIAYISPVGTESTQSVVVRAILNNLDTIWKPGLFVKGEITVDKTTLAVAVRKEALQKFRDWDVVFLSVGNKFEVVPVQLGRSNREWVEITSGLNLGDLYVSENSFILKADLEKSGAKHEH